MTWSCTYFVITYNDTNNVNICYSFIYGWDSIMSFTKSLLHRNMMENYTHASVISRKMSLWTVVSRLSVYTMGLKHRGAQGTIAGDVWHILVSRVRYSSGLFDMRFSALFKRKSREIVSYCFRSCTERFWESLSDDVTRASSLESSSRWLAIFLLRSYTPRMELNLSCGPRIFT